MGFLSITRYHAHKHSHLGLFIVAKPPATYFSEVGRNFSIHLRQLLKAAFIDLVMKAKYVDCVTLKALLYDVFFARKECFDSFNLTKNLRSGHPTVVIKISI